MLLTYDGHMDPLLIDGETLTIDQVHEVAFDRRRVALNPDAKQRMSRARELIDSIVAEDLVVYGVSTGFGKLSDVHVGHDQITTLQHNLVRSHACGVGDPLNPAEVRALMLLRA